MSKIRIDSYTLRQLKTKFDERVFAIPDIQRQYVWNKQRVCALMDSIFRDYPIGISLVWTAPYSQIINIRPNNRTIIPPFNTRLKKSDLIIDGQQRLSTLYGVLFGVEPKPDANSDINFNELYFDCHKKEEKRFFFSKRDLQGGGNIQLKALLTTSPSLLRSRLKLNNWEASEAEKCYNTFHKYKFYLLAFEGLGYDDAKEIFIRINSGGLKVSRADTLFARASNVDLRDHMLSAKRGLKYGYDNISVDALQASLGLAYGATKIGNLGFNYFLKKIEKSKKNNKEFEKKWKHLQYGYKEAVDFLVNHLNLTKLELLPSQNIYSMLSYFFYLNQSRAKPNQIRELKKWFWHTACGERYSGSGFNRNIPEDIVFFQKLAKNSNAKYLITENIFPIDFLKSSYKNPGASSTSAYFIMLRNKRPKYLLNGAEILLDNASEMSNRKDRHHIFPNAYLKRRNINHKWINSITNICYLESDENQGASDNHPRIYLEEFKRLRHFGSVMKSNLIPYDKASPIWEHDARKGFLEFLNYRGKTIITEIEKLAGAKIFDKFDAIRRI
ncbi:MAG TPA: DUF262 domain-containing protein [Chitinophagales bacterium]|nr:DUF262 domain-containing protein [Chitinophagales bacterium]